MDMEFVSRLLQAVFLAIMPVLAGAAVRWVLVAVKRESRRLDAQTLDMLVRLAGMAVRAAEQAQLGGLIADKKQYALDFLEGWFAQRGVRMDLESLSAAIEAAVLEEFPKGGL